MLPVIFGSPGLPLISDHMEEISLQEIERTVFGVAESSACLDNLVQHGLQPSRTRNGAKDAADCALLLAEVFELSRSVLVSAGGCHWAQLTLA